MCGICGIWYFDPTRNVEDVVLHAMTGQLAHRGPDGTGFYCCGSLGLGVRRLKVIDPVGSDQPLSNEDRRLWLVCNGEIYNYRSLRSDLKEHHHFATNGDAETILHLYEDYGARCVEKLRGMFAFALWDGRSEQLTLAVDRFGKKPLYYAQDAEKLVFGSEIKALLRCPGVSREIDYEALDEYFSCGYITAPRSIFRAIRKLSAGNILTVQHSGVTTVEPYWRPVFAEPSQWDKRSPSDLAAELRYLLLEAVRMRLASDVPVGALLSGGVDSSAVVALMRLLDQTPIKTFSVGFAEPAYDERRYAKAAADHLQTEHHTVMVRSQDALDLVPKLVRHYDEPFADSSMIPTYIVSQLARQYVTVVLTGDGGDEVFAGYHQHLYSYRQKFLESVIPAALHPAAVYLAARLPRAAKVTPYLAALGRPMQHWLGSGSFSTQQRDALYHDETRRFLDGYRSEQIKVEVFRRVARLDGLSQLQTHDLSGYLPGDILTKVDRASMLASLEVRSPLLDHVVFEFMACVPPRHRMGLTTGKKLLKQALGALLPSFVHQRKKQGFSIPQAEWLRGPLQPLLREVLREPSPLLNRHYITTLLDEHTAGIIDHKDRLWVLLCFELWRREQPT